MNLAFDNTTGKRLPLPGVILPRYAKSTEEKTKRTKKKAEVFTPVWIIKKMVDEVWEDDLDETYLEICCGEAPFITTRYEPDTGVPIVFWDRVGVLDRKLQLALTRATTTDELINLMTRAVKSVYGYEYQPDSLYLARMNVMASLWETVLEWDCEETDLIWCRISDGLENIVIGNFFWMDGLTGCVPGTDIPAIVYDRDKSRLVEFRSMQGVFNE